MRNRQKIIIVLLFTLIVFLISLIGVGLYKFYNVKKILEELNVPEVVEEIVEKKAPTRKIENEVVPIIPEEELEDMDMEEDVELIEDETTEEKELELKIESPSLEKQELTSIFIPRTRSLFAKVSSLEDLFANKTPMTSEQRVYLKINEIKATDFATTSLENLFLGKLYYQGDNGRLESFLYLDSQGMVREYLVSYDPKGNVVDYIEIGIIISEAGRKKYATLSVNKLSVFELSQPEAGNRRRELVTEYSITPQLRFNKGRTFSKLEPFQIFV